MNPKKHSLYRGFLWATYNIILKPFFSIKYGYKVKSKYKIQKDEPIFVVCNHQTDLDALFVQYSFNKILHVVATDTIFTKGIVANTLTTLGAIPKRKGTIDYKCNTEMLNVMKNNGGVLVFLEGNRTYADFQFYISPFVGKFIKSTNATLIIYNLHGGTGVFPRFAHKKRKGRFFGEIKKVITKDEYMEMSDDELSQEIISNLRVIDAESNALYKSNIRAEYLERMLFVCPHCGSHSHLVSDGNVFKCTECGYSVEFGEDLKLHPINDSKPETNLKDWYNMQKKWVLDYKVKEKETIFTDKDIVLKIVDPFEKRVTVYEGNMSLTDKELIFGEKRFPLINICNASPISGTKLSFTDNEHNYLVFGNPRFNPLKYVLMFNKLETTMKIKHVDDYYRLDVEEK